MQKNRCNLVRKECCMGTYIANTFNFNSGKVFRSKKTLKTKYEDIKKSIKKKLTHNRMEQFKIGGGKSEIRSLISVEESILPILPLSIEGLYWIVINQVLIHHFIRVMWDIYITLFKTALKFFFSIEIYKENAIITNTEMHSMETNNNMHVDNIDLQTIHIL